MCSCPLSVPTQHLVEAIVGTINPTADGTIASSVAVRGRIVGNATANTYLLSSVEGLLSESDLASANGVVYNWYGARVTLNNAGTIGNTYGLYIGDISSGTQTNAPWAVYQADVSANNYFAGRVGIGNTTPSHALRVEGTTSLNGAVGMNGALNVEGTMIANGAVFVMTGMVVPVGADMWVAA